MSAVVQEGKKRQVSRKKGQGRQPAPRSCLLSSRRARRDRSEGLKVRGDNLYLRVMPTVVLYSSVEIIQYLSRIVVTMGR